MEIAARIPSSEEPPHIVVDKDGNLPSLDRLQGTRETTLGTVTRSVIGKVLSVDKLLTSTSHPEKTVYQTTPVSFNTIPREGYQWVLASSSVAEHKAVESLDKS